MHTFKIIGAVAILTAMIIGTSMYTTHTLSSTSKDLDVKIKQIAESASQGNWEKAKQDLSNIEENWAKTEKTWAMLIDHMEIDNIEAAMARMSKFIETKDLPLALAEASLLSQYIKHIPERESFQVKNLF